MFWYIPGKVDIVSNTDNGTPYIARTDKFHIKAN